MGSPLLARAGLVVAGFAAVLLMLGAIEVSLRLLGVGAERRHDPFAGFSNIVRMFDLEQRPDGTAVYRTSPARQTRGGEQVFLADKPANGFRAFVVGGSSAVGLPYGYDYAFAGWLDRRLEAELPDLEIEVVNAAVPGYASRRILAVVEELAGYEPDLLIVYSGHNELVARRFYAHLLDMDPVLFRLWTAVASTRLYGVLSDLLGDAESRSGRTIDFEDDDPFEQMFAAGSRLLSERDREELEREASYGEMLYRFNLEQMIRSARAAGARVMLLSLSQNYADWAPATRYHGREVGASELQRWRALVAEGEALAPRDCPAALERWNRALAIDDEAADLHWRVASCLRELGRWQEARRHYRLASDRDAGAQGAPTHYNDLLRALAHEHDTLFFDVDALLEHASEHGLVGDDFFVDMLHPNLRAHLLIAEAVGDALAAEGIPRPSAERHAGAWKPPSPEALHAENPELARLELLMRGAACALLVRTDCVMETTGRILAEDPADVRAQKVREMAVAIAEWQRRNLEAGSR